LPRDRRRRCFTHRKDRVTTGYLGAIAVAIALGRLRRLQRMRRRSEL
jgi:2-methylcitrate dehydratase PrpD